MSKAPAISEEHAVELAEMFRLMGDGTRLRIIVACMAGAKCVSDIAAELGLSASLVSHHLRLLRGARILRAERRGKQVFYSPADDHIRCVLDDMTAHVGESAGDGAGEGVGEGDPKTPVKGGGVALEPA